MTSTPDTSETGSAQSPDAIATSLPPSAMLQGATVMLGPSALLDLLGVAGTVAVWRGVLRQPRAGVARLVPPVVALAAASPWLYWLFVRPRMARWGATDEEATMPLPGDEVGAHPVFVSTRAITIKAPVATVWSWLAQIGQDRGGFYSFTWLENLAGAQIRNADRVHPDWQARAVGEVVRMTPFSGPKVAAFEPNNAIVLEGGWTFAVRPIDEHSTRLILRSRSPGWTALYAALLMDIPHFIMEVGMLRGLKRRAEGRGAAPAPSAFSTLLGQDFMALTTYRSSGEGVATPVWFAEEDGRLFVHTALSSGKVKRIRHTPRVSVAACWPWGATRGPASEGEARLLPESEHPRAEAALRRKYGWQIPVFGLFAGDAPHTYLEIRYDGA